MQGWRTCTNGSDCALLKDTYTGGAVMVQGQRYTIYQGSLSLRHYSIQETPHTLPLKMIS